MQKIFLIIFILTLFFQTTFAVDPLKFITQYRYDVWTTREGLVGGGIARQGLPTASITSITQTNDGYIWLGSEMGLIRFNGVSFTVYNYQNTPEIWKQGVGQITADKNGNLWLGSDKLIQFSKNKFKVYEPTNKTTPDLLTAIKTDRNGGVWAGFKNYGLVKFSDNKLNDIIRTTEKRDNITAIAEDNNNGIYVIHSEKRYIEKIQDGKISTVFDNHGLLLSLNFARNNNMLVGSVGSFFIVNKNKIAQIKVGSESNGVRTIMEDKDGNIWAGCEEGLFRYYNGKVEQVEKSIIPGKVMHLFEDIEGNIWVSMKVFGIVRIKDVLVTTFGYKEGLPEDDIRAIYKDKDGSMWFGTKVGGLCHLKDGKIKTYVNSDGLISNWIGVIYRDKKDRLWIGTEMALVYMNGNNFVKTLEGFRIDALAEDNDGTLWIGSTHKYLYTYKNNKFTDFFKTYNIKPDEVRVILTDNDGVWFGGQNGLYLISTDNTIKQFTKKDGLSTNTIRCLHKDTDGNLWIGTMFGGLIKYRDGKFKVYSTKDGLVNDAIFQIKEDWQYKLWIGSKSGIFYIPIKNFNDFDDGKINNLNAIQLRYTDGIRTDECSVNSQYLSWSNSRKDVWIPTALGAVHIPIKLDDKIYPPIPVYIEEVKINNQNYDITKFQEIPPSDGRLEVNYTGLNYAEPENVKFKIFLEGFDKDWMEVGGLRTALYTSLPPDKYTFKVKGCSPQGEWNNNAATFSFVIKPHFYQTVWMYFLIAIVLFFMVWGFIHLRLRQIKAREVELKARVDEAVAQIKVLSGLVPICANCKKVRDDKGYWTQVEAYVQDRSDAKFSHSVCPECAKILYPQYYKDKDGHS